MLIPVGMDDTDRHPAIDRIERAVERIEQASMARVRAGDSLARRHAALRARMAEAVKALDELIAREDRKGGGNG
jgi:hypothetical protein